MIDKNRLIEILSRLGESLDSPAKICIFGSGATILEGQDGRQTQDIDIWRNQSSVDLGALQRACKNAGILFSPDGDVPPDAEYLKIVRPGVVRLPESFPLEVKEVFGRLEVVTPPMSLIAALKLARGTEVDLEDAAWVIKSRLCTIDDVKAWAYKIPDEVLSETSLENVTFVKLLLDREGYGSTSPP